MKRSLFNFSPVFLSCFFMLISHVGMSQFGQQKSKDEKKCEECKDYEEVYNRLETCINANKENRKKIYACQDAIETYKDTIEIYEDSILYLENIITVIRHSSDNIIDENNFQYVSPSDSVIVEIIQDLRASNQTLQERLQVANEELVICRNTVSDLRSIKRRLELKVNRLVSDTTRMGIEIRGLRIDTTRMGVEIRGLRLDTTRMGVETRGLRLDTTRMGIEIRNLENEVQILNKDIDVLDTLLRESCTKIYAEYKVPFVRKRKNINVLIESRELGLRNNRNSNKIPKLKAGKIQSLIFSTCLLDREEPESLLNVPKIVISVSKIVSGDTILVPELSLSNEQLRAGKKAFQGKTFAYYEDRNIVVSTRVENEGFFRRLGTAWKEKRWLYFFKKNILEKETHYYYKIEHGRDVIREGDFKTYPLDF